MSQAILPRGTLHLRVGVLALHRRLSSHAPSAAAGGGYAGERSRWQQEESKAVKVSVWWDFQRCQLPPGANPCRVAQRVTAALRGAGIRGPVEITAFGDVYVLPRAVQDALATTGVAFSHVPSSGKDGSDRSFMADLINWIAQNPPPVHVFLISGDKGFANILHRLRMSNYNILLACPNTDSSALCSAATIMWPWDALVKGTGLSPKHFNQPPDGLSFSWYGHYRGALDDPFGNTESEDCMASPSDTKPVKPPIVPKYFVNGVKQALYAYPEGVNLTDLRAELKKNNVFVDKGLFGFKKFSALLQSMPDVVKFIDPLPGESQPAVVGIFKGSVAPAEQTAKKVSSAQSNGEVKRLNETKNEKPPSFDVSSSLSDLLSTEQTKTLAVNAPSSQSDISFRNQRKAPPVDPTTQSEPPASGMEANVVTAAGTPSSLGAQGSASKKGLFERIYILWNGPESAEPMPCPSHHSSCAKGSNDLPIQERHSNDQHNSLSERILKNFSRTDNSDGKDLDGTFSVGTSVSGITSADRSDKLNVKENPENNTNHPNKADMSKAEHKVGFGEKNKGIFSWAARWWTSGKSDADDNRISTDIIDGTKKESDKEPAIVKTAVSANRQEVGIELFKKVYFWDALQQFLCTPNGSDLVSKAKTREELAHGLRKQGCWPLKGLDEKYHHQLVDLLVSEKKWIEESPSKSFPFVLTVPQNRTGALLHSNKSSVLSSLFTNGKLSRKTVQVSPATNGKGKASCNGNENHQSNGDEVEWDELGPVSSTGKARQETDKGMSYHPPTHSDDEFTDGEDYEVGQRAGKDAAHSSLLKIIDSWNTNKAGYNKKYSDRQVDCSRINRAYHDNLISGNAQKPTSLPQYSFVSDSDSDEKDKLVSSVLGSMQKVKTASLPG